MKNIFTIIIVALAALSAHAQVLTAFIPNPKVLYNNGATLTLTTGGTMQVNGNAQFQSGGILSNDGAIALTGNITNNQTMSAANAGALIFNGTAAQTLSGSGTYFAKDVLVNNANGVTLSAPLKIDGVCSFSSGIVTAATTANAIVFTTNASVSSSNAANDVSHINGFVVKEGAGSFAFPVGDGTKYQTVAVDATANATGIRVKYNATDAGAGAFTTGGAEPTALASYNTNEYWDITPLSSAMGAVTIFWDGYQDAYSNPTTERKVAHLTGSN